MAGEDQRGFELPCPYGKYQLLERIGSGGMAEVFLARRPGIAGFEKKVVVKRLHPRFANNVRFVQMFIDEAKLAAKVDHKNVVQIYELEQLTDGEFFIVMEYVEGTDLKKLLRRAVKKGVRIPPWLSIHAVIEILEALSYAHSLTDDLGRARNVVHCDVSPENIFVSRQGDIKLADFGVAVDDTRQDHFPGMIKGKAGYLSPEQVTQVKLDGRSDVFSAGVVLWECLAQRRLFSGATAPEVMSRVCAAPRMPPSHYAEDVPPELDACALSALQPNRNHRPSSARELQEMLIEVLARMRPRVTVADVRDVIDQVLDVEDVALDVATDLSQAEQDISDEPTDSDLTRNTQTERLRKQRRPDASTYSIINPRNAVEDLRQVPIPIPGTPSDMETGDLPRNPSGPMPAVPNRYSNFETGDILAVRRPQPAYPIWVRTAEQGQFGPLGAREAVGWVASHSPNGPRSSTQLSSDGLHWMPVEQVSDLLGEQTIDADRALPSTQFAGTLGSNSLVSVVGHIAATRPTGRLIVLRARGESIDRRELYIEGGSLIDLHSSLRPLELWNMLLQSRLVPEPETGQLFHALVRTGQSIDELAPRSVKAVSRAMRARMVQRHLEDMFGWTHGNFGFEVGPVSSNRKGRAVSLLRLLPVLVARAQTDSSLRESLVRWLDVPLQRIEGFDARVEELGLRDVAVKRLEPFGLGFTLVESLAQSSTPRDEKLAMLLAYLLIELGLLRRPSVQGSVQLLA